jgi:5-methylcytosine-specific restriction endonuclease McrA
MPKMPCLDCGVPTLRSRCEQCQENHNIMKPQRIRATSDARGYDYAWRKIRIQILNRDNWRCHYCEKVLSGSDATVDHLQPLSKFGAKLDPSNLVAACRSCNSKKKDKA